jgi:hypothetical protein
MSDDEIIARLLERITENNDKNSSFELFPLLRWITGTEERGYINLLKERIKERIRVEEIAKLLHSDASVAPNNKTREIVQNGGYLLYLAQERDRVKREEMDKENKNNYYYWQSKQSKWLYKFRWWPYIISILALIVSIIALFRTCLS